jgi:hypothetical protein
MKHAGVVYRIVIVLVATVLVCTMTRTAELAPVTITFSEFPLGTSISTQYSPQGVRFTGSGNGPFISGDSSNPTAPVLSGDPQFTGSITATFVAPANPANRATAKNVSFDAGFFDDVGTTTVSWFDINSNPLGSQTNSTTGIERFTIPGNIGGFTIAISTNEPAGFAIDNLTFEINAQQVEITVADITMDRIVVVLTPDSDSGQLVLTLIGDRNATLFDGVQAGGTHEFQFNPDTLREGQYTQVEAVWTVNGTPARGVRDVSFRVLGTYRHSQYNVPSEATCGGNPARAFITDSSCNFTETTLLHRFIQQVNLNGSGHSINFGDLGREFFCVGQPGAPGGSNQRSYRQQTISPTCAGAALDNTTVARRPGHPFLDCGDQVLIRTGGTGTIKTVTDLCPGCPNNQLDNFTTDTACSGIADLGRFVTIRLR